MKKVLVALLCVVSFSAMQAQVSFGVKGGVNFANVTNSDGGKTRIGFNGGVQVSIPVTEQFSVQPEAVYSSQGVKGDDDMQAILNYVNFPVLLQYNNPSGFFAHTGPQLSFLTSAKFKQGSEEVDVKDAFKSTDFGWAFGAGYALPSGFGFNGRYNLGLSKIEEGDDAGSSKNSVFQLGIFYNFGKAKSAK
jgi:hypothetical protein